MAHFVVGTAGHIDHGKSELVKALTGINPDRLEEERRRGMTIDLGFAFYDLPSGNRIGIVDVPGHERFVKNMLAGATGIDLVLLVIAADEGVMPQTREHLDILNLLHVKKGIIVVSKIDLVDDKDWLELVEKDIRENVRDTFLAEAPVVMTSARTKHGLDELVQAIDEALFEAQARHLNLPARYPVDRVFVMSGFGTVVTGTLWQGVIKLGDNLELLPAGKTVRIRQIQSHGEKLEQGEAGMRLAMNLAGLSREEVIRGDVLCTPSYFKPTNLVDVRLKLLKDAPALKNNDRVHFFLGTGEVLARLKLLDRDELKPGENALSQLKLEQPVVATWKDPFVIRSYSPVVTIGGGEVIEPNAMRKKRFVKAVLDCLAVKEKGSEGEYLEEILKEAALLGLAKSEVGRRLNRLDKDAAKKVEELVADKKAIVVGERIFHHLFYQKLKEQMVKKVEEFVKANPWSVGILKEELKGRFPALSDRKVYETLLTELEREGQFELERERVLLGGGKGKPSTREQEIKDKVERIYRKQKYSPPTGEEIKAMFDKDGLLARKMVDMLVVEKKLVKVGSDMCFHATAIEAMRQSVIDFLKNNGKMTVAEFRDLIGTSRKYALPLIQHFDRLKITKRVGDDRILY